MTTLLLAALLMAAPVVISAEKAAPQAAPDDRQPSGQPGQWVAEYVEYRCLPELGQITISDRIVRGRKPVEYLHSHGKELAARGVFSCADRSCAAPAGGLTGWAAAPSTRWWPPRHQRTATVAGPAESPSRSTAAKRSTVPSATRRTASCSSTASRSSRKTARSKSPP